MFKQLLGKIARSKASETQRQTIGRALAELNEVVGGMEIKPAITIDPATGAIDLSLPEQMPDEALALPAPDSVDVSEDTEEPKDAAA